MKVNPNAKPAAITNNQTAGGGKFAKVLDEMARDNRRIERSMRREARSTETSPQKLLELQLTVYRYTQRVDMAAKLVDQAKDATKTVLQSQQ